MVDCFVDIPGIEVLVLTRVNWKSVATDERGQAVGGKGFADKDTVPSKGLGSWKGGEGGRNR